MREIYGMAYASFIWLEITVRIARFALVRGQSDLFVVEGKPRVVSQLKYAKPELGGRQSRNGDLGCTHGKVMQLARLFERHRAWWCRTWIIQEMVLLDRLYVCVGSNVMRWDQLVSSCHDWMSIATHLLVSLRIPPRS